MQRLAGEYHIFLSAQQFAELQRRARMDGESTSAALRRILRNAARTQAGAPWNVKLLPPCAPTKRVHVRLDEDTIRGMRTIAEALEAPMASVVRGLIRAEVVG